MRENCTYGSMRDILRAEGESRSDALAEVRAFPTGRPALLYTLGVHIAVAGGEKNRYLPGKQYRILRKGKAVIRV